MKEAAHLFAANLQIPYGQYLVGPAEPVVGRVRNLFLMELLIKLPRDSNMISKCKSDLQKQIASLHADKKFRAVIIVPDIDPV